MSDWYCNINGSASGPYSIDELRFLRDRGKLETQDAVRRGADGTWKSANCYIEIFPRSSDASSDTTSVGSAPAQELEALEPQVAEPEAPLIDENQARPPIPPVSKSNYRRAKQILVGCTIGTGIAILILLLLMLFVDAGGSRGTLAGRGFGQEEGTGTGAGESDKTGATRGADEVKGEDEVSEPSTDAGDSSPDSLDHQSTPEETLQFELPPETGFSVRPLQAPPAEASGSGGGGTGGEGASSPGTVKTIGGVRVKGAIALVCDISGSMATDFPVLVKELRRKFPKDTPLILVNGCCFNAPNPTGVAPQTTMEMAYFKQLQKQLPYLQVLADDQHVFYGQSTTDAIIFAVEELKRSTVVFNNDLQDSGSELAIEAFRELREKHKFTLSGRSLNCDAPSRLLEFIEDSGGDFKVDTIGRPRMPAQPWSR